MPPFTPAPCQMYSVWTKNSLRLNNHSFSGLSHWPGKYVRDAVTAEIPLARYIYVRGAVTAEIPLARYVRTWCSHCRDPIGQVCTYVVQSLQRSHWPGIYTYVVQSLQRSHWPGMYVRGAVTAEISLARYVRTWCSHCRDRAALGFQTLTLIIPIVVILLLESSVHFR